MPLLRDFEFFTRLSNTFKREIGVCLCNDGEAFLTFGGERSGQIRCGQCESFLLFHTHPFGKPLPSEGDLLHLLNHEGKLDNVAYCVGAMENNKPEVNCVKITKRGNRLKISPF
ncbi:MAG: hypothetical protein ACUVUF_06925 [Candidatus Bathycorpusculaceae bacterium]